MKGRKRKERKRNRDREKVQYASVCPELGSPVLM